MTTHARILFLLCLGLLALSRAAACVPDDSRQASAGWLSLPSAANATPGANAVSSPVSFRSAPGNSHSRHVADQSPRAKSDTESHQMESGQCPCCDDCQCAQCQDACGCAVHVAIAPAVWTAWSRHRSRFESIVRPQPIIPLFFPIDSPPD